MTRLISKLGRAGTALLVIAAVLVPAGNPSQAWTLKAPNEF